MGFSNCFIRQTKNVLFLPPTKTIFVSVWAKKITKKPYIFIENHFNEKGWFIIKQGTAALQILIIGNFRFFCHVYLYFGEYLKFLFCLKLTFFETLLSSPMFFFQSLKTQFKENGLLLYQLQIIILYETLSFRFKNPC